jgi:hypothetical protein
MGESIHSGFGLETSIVVGVVIFSFCELSVRLIGGAVVEIVKYNRTHAKLI